MIRTENVLVEEDKVKIFHTKDEIVELGLTSFDGIKNTKHSKKFLFDADEEEKNNKSMTNNDGNNMGIFAKKRMSSKKVRKNNPNDIDKRRSESPQFNFEFKDPSKKNKR